MLNHEIDYQIHGEEMQFVEVELDPQETAIAEAGSFMNNIWRRQSATKRFIKQVVFGWQKIAGRRELVYDCLHQYRFW